MLSNAVCPNCGSDDITVEEDGFFCEDCLSSFELENADAPDDMIDGDEIEITI